jgi:16S rRNA (guanine527-N7)-methyltransferase
VTTADDPGHGGSPDEPAPLDEHDPRVASFFGPRLPDVAAYASMLADEGVLRGLIGPREVPRLWERHILNSASVAQFLPAQGTVLDLGSGAGLPGVVLAAMRADLDVTLLEPMERRVAWLTKVVEQVGLRNVRVVRGRAEEQQGQIRVDVVTARAVAPMERLAAWALPLLRQNGALLALKGSRGEEELVDAREVIHAYGGDTGEVLDAPTIPGVDSTRVVRVTRRTLAEPAPKSKQARRRRR